VFVVKVFKLVNKEDFTNFLLNITEDESEIIRDLCIQRGYLLQDYFLTPTYDIYNVISLNNDKYDQI